MQIGRVDILLIDDEPDVRGLLRDVLTDAGHVVVEESDGTKASALLRETVFDVIVSDVRLPGVDGLTLLRTARRDAPLTDFILMTAFARRGPGRGRPQGGGIGLPHQALRCRRGPPSHRSDRQHPVDAARARRGAARLLLRSPSNRLVGPVRPDVEAQVSHRDDRAQRRGNDDHGRERHGERAGGTVASRAEPALQQAVRGGQLRCLPRNADRGGAVRLRTRALSRGPSRSARDASARPTGELCFWTRSPSCRRRRRPSCCASSRMERSNRWEPTSPSRSTSG